MWHACKTSVTFCDSQRQRHHDGICINDFTAVTNSPLHLRMFLSSGTLTDEHFLAHFHLVEMFTIGASRCLKCSPQDMSQQQNLNTSKMLTTILWYSTKYLVTEISLEPQMFTAGLKISQFPDCEELRWSRTHIEISQARHSSDSY